MRILPGVLLLAVAAAALPEGEEREVAALKEKIQAMRDEAALLEQAGRKDEAGRAREEAAALEHALAGKKGDPRAQALLNLEKAIGSLEKAGYEGMAKELRGMEQRLRAEVKGARGHERVAVDLPGPDFWRRNLDTLRIARKALAETGRHDGADVMERAIHARELLLEGRHDMAERAMKEGPDDGHLSEMLFKAGQCCRELKQPENAERCEELSRFLKRVLQQRKEMERRDPREAQGRGELVERKVAEFERKYQRHGPIPEDRLARVEERLDRMERMLHDALERLEQRDRDRRER